MILGLVHAIASSHWKTKMLITQSLIPPCTSRQVNKERVLLLFRPWRIVFDKYVAFYTLGSLTWHTQQESILSRVED